MVSLSLRDNEELSSQETGLQGGNREVITDKACFMIWLKEGEHDRTTDQELVL